MTARYRVYARDVDRRNLGEIPDFEQVVAQLRFNDVGSFVLTASASSRAAALLAETGGIIVTRDLLDGNGPHVVFSGPITTYKLDGWTLEASGASDELVLAEKAALPDPTTDEPPYATEQDLREGTCSTIMLEYVQVNAVIPFAAGTRGVGGLEIGPDPGLGGYRYGQARFISLLALMQDLAAVDGLRFQVLQSDRSAGTITFSVSRPNDLAGRVVLAEGRGNVGAWSRVVNRPAATSVITLGQGQGEDRMAVKGVDAVASTRWGYEIEAIDDRRDVPDILALEQANAAALIDSGEDQLVSYTPRDTPALRWGLDYDLGDLVTVLTPDGQTLEEVVRGVDLTLTIPGGSGAAAEVQPIVSTPGDPADDPASRQQRRVARRVSNLERNVDSLSSVLLGLHHVGDLRMTARTVAAAGWLLCEGQAVSRTTYSLLFDVIGTTYGAGDGSTTFNVPDFRDRFPVGKSGTKALGSMGGAATVDASHGHGAGTLLGPLHGHAAGTLLGPSHDHGPGSYTNPNHPHAAGTLATTHNHGAGTLVAADHSHGAGTYSLSHTHPAGTLSGPLHQHGSSGLTASASDIGAPIEAPVTAGTGAVSASPGSHTHPGPSITMGGSTAFDGNTSVTGNTGTNATSSVSGSSGTSGSLSVTGSTANNTTTGLTGSTASDGTAGITGTSATSGTGSVTGSTANGGNGSVTGSTASDGTGGVTGSTATGSGSLAIVPLFLAVHYEIYAAA